MKRILVLFLTALMLFAAACGSGGGNDAADDPNLGVYKAVTAEYSGFTVGVDSFFEKGFTIELKPKGKCTLTADGTSASGKWTLEGTAFTVKGGGIDCAGTLQDGKIRLQYNEDVIFNFVNDAYVSPAAKADLTEAPRPADTQAPENAASESTVPLQTEQKPEPVQEGSETTGQAKQEQTGSGGSSLSSVTYMAVAYTAGGYTIEGELLKSSGMDQNGLILNSDHTGIAILTGQTMAVEWTDDGRILMNGAELGSFTYEDEETVLFSPYNAATFRLKRSEGSPLVQTEGNNSQSVAEKPTEKPTEQATQKPEQAPVQNTGSGNGEPYGNSDGVISHEKLAGLYRWLSETDSEFRKTLTFDDVGAAVGKQGADKKNGDEKYHAAYWYDGSRYYVTITFYNRSGQWTVGSISTGIPSSEWSKADISSFPVLGNRQAGSSRTKSVKLEGQIGRSGPKIPVTADIPSENWFSDVSSGSIRYSNAPNEKSVNGNSPGIRLEFKESLEKIDFYKDKFQNMADIGSRTIAGIEMPGRSYNYTGMDWIEYYGQITDGVWVSVKMTKIDPYAGSEAEAILSSIRFGTPQ